MNAFVHYVTREGKQRGQWGSGGVSDESEEGFFQTCQTLWFAVIYHVQVRSYNLRDITMILKNFPIVVQTNLYDVCLQRWLKTNVNSWDFGNCLQYHIYLQIFNIISHYYLIALMHTKTLDNRTVINLKTKNCRNANPSESLRKRCPKLLPSTTVFLNSHLTGL